MVFRVKDAELGRSIVFEVTRPEEADVVLPTVMEHASHFPDIDVTMVGPLDPDDPDHAHDIHKGEGKNTIHYYARSPRRG